MVKKIHASNTKPRAETYSKTSVETDRLCATSENKVGDPFLPAGLGCTCRLCVPHELPDHAAQDALVSATQDPARSSAPPRPRRTPGAAAGSMVQFSTLLGYRYCRFAFSRLLAGPTRHQKNKAKERKKKKFRGRDSLNMFSNVPKLQ